MNVTTAQISELRERTGAGLSDCKKALIEANANMDQAIAILRQKGKASAANKAGKIAAEGAVCARINLEGTCGILLELNCQTDFAAKNEKFTSLLEQIAQIALTQAPVTLEQLLLCQNHESKTIHDLIQDSFSYIGEKIDLRRYSLIKAASGERLLSYTHPIGSKIAVLGKISNGHEALCKDIAMHIAAHQPQPEFLNRNEIPQEIMEREREIELGKEDLANKPLEIREKIVLGRVEKVLLEKVLLEQGFIKEPNKKIKDLLQEHKAEMICFTCFNLGEGIQKNQTNFADEVAAQTGQKVNA